MQFITLYCTAIDRQVDIFISLRVGGLLLLAKLKLASLCARRNKLKMCGMFCELWALK